MFHDASGGEMLLLQPFIAKLTEYYCKTAQVMLQLEIEEHWERLVPVASKLFALRARFALASPSRRLYALKPFTAIAKVYCCVISAALH